MIDLNQGSTRRGLVDLMVCIVVGYCWLIGDIQKAMGAITIGTALRSYIGITHDDRGDYER
jgi:hypothetical protein